MGCCQLITSAEYIAILLLVFVRNSENLRKFHCDETSCERACLFGHLLTEHGCITCDCYNPCMARICPEHMGCDVNITSCAVIPCIYETFCYPICPIIDCNKDCRRYKVDRFSCQTCECKETRTNSSESSIRTTDIYPEQ